MPMAHTPMGSPRFKHKEPGRIRKWLRKNFTETYSSASSHQAPTPERRPWQVVEAEKAAKAGRRSPYVFFEPPKLGMGSTLAVNRLVAWLEEKELAGNNGHGHEAHGGHGGTGLISAQKAKEILAAKIKWGQVEEARNELNHQLATLSAGEIQELNLLRGFPKTVHAGGSRRGLAAKIFGEKTSYRKTKRPATKITIPRIPIIRHIPIVNFLAEHLVVPAVSGVANALTYPVRKRRTVGHVLSGDLQVLAERLQRAQIEFEQSSSRISETDIRAFDKTFEQFYREAEHKGDKTH